MTDGGAEAVVHAAHQLGVPVAAAATGRRIVLPAGADTDVLLRRLVANPIIEHWTHGPADARPPPRLRRRPGRRGRGGPRPRRRRASPASASARSLALDPEELAVIRDHFTSIGRDPTDVELETLAQTWSEHCAHKTFRAAITTDDGTGEPVDLLGLLRGATDTVAAPFVRSAFVGNAGIVSFVPGTTIALKAETHNHPSAVEPFGGANTGVGGVIRDVLGAAHRPIACTDVLCFGPPDLPLDELPDGSLHPRRIREGVIDGVADYGNKIGLPTVAGAVLYDRAYTTNPLVFCGCIGVAADRPLPDRPVPRRPGRRARRAHRPRRHPRGDVLQRHDGRHHRRGRRGQRADRRPGHREAADRRAHRRRSTSGRRSPTAAPAGCRRRSARWPSTSAPTSS